MFQEDVNGVGGDKRFLIAFWVTVHGFRGCGFRGSRFRGSRFSPAAGLKSGLFNQKRNFVLDLPFEAA